jgi:L,D-transpeptidase catalytic domain
LLDTVTTLIGLSLATSDPPGLKSLHPQMQEPPAIVVDISQSLLEARKGTRFVVDTKENMGYLMHADGSFASFRVATGKNEDVRYLGMKYKASTPEDTWTVKSRHVQPDRVTFGKNGRFLRLYRNGTEYTHYGIHGYAYLDEILEKPAEERYFSMGCVLVTPEVLKILEKIYELNGNQLEVTTIYGLQTPMVASN